MDNKNFLLPVTSDFIFKLIFGDKRNVDVLGAFLRSVLDIPDEEYEHLVIVDPHVKKESANDKYGILDVKLHTVSGSVIHIEIQVRVLPDMKARTIYSQSKLVTEQMSSGMKWSDIKRTITIVITSEEFISEGDKYHNQFRYRTNDGIEFTDFTEINTLDLSKLPADGDNTELWYWMKFIKTNDVEVLDMLETRSPQMRKAVGVLKELSADEQTRMLYESREMARRDYESLLDAANAAIAEKDISIAKQAATLTEQAATLTEQAATLTEQAATLTEQAAEIASLRTQLENKKNSSYQ